MKKNFFRIVFVHLLMVSLPGCTGEQPADTAGAETDTAVRSTRLAGLLGADSDAAFPRVTEPREFRFPDDHGPHPEYRNEWWYVTGNLDSDGGERLGYELTLFRFALVPTSATKVDETSSGWRSRQVYVGHFAITAADRGRFVTAERYSRAAIGLAGAQSRPFRVWLEDWEIAAHPASEAEAVTFRLRAADAEIAADLILVAEKPPVLNGERGLSKKSAEPGNASYYYSMTRLATRGTLRVGGDQLSVSGSSWLDREWGSSALSREQVGWDWFALQLDDGTELMFYSIRWRDGRQDAASAGTFIGADAKAQPLRRDDVVIDVLDQWDSPRGGRYPARWRLSVPALDMVVELRPVLDDQELLTAVRYWEGAVDVSGSRQGRRIGGRGYVELTGYAE